MPTNFFALVFPEYFDPENSVTSQDWMTRDLPDDKSLGLFIRDLQSFVDFYDDEECEMIYDGKNASAFIYPLNILHDYYPSRTREFRLALKKLENWRRNRESSLTDNYIINGMIIRDELRSEIVSRLIRNPNDSYILIVHIPNYTAKEWQLPKEEKIYKIKSIPLSIIEAFNWISHHRSLERCYNWNPKHGENGVGAHSDHNGNNISVLYCSREHAAELMQKAIGVPNYDTLYCYDAENSMYMEYRAECKFEHLPPNTTIRQYHSFHLTNDTSIPNRVKKKIKVLENCIAGKRG